MNKWSSIRDILLFTGGLAGVFHETALTTGERPSLLLLFGAMMGLPAIRRWDEKRGSTSTSSPTPENQNPLGE